VKYVDSFMELDCAADVLAATGPIHKGGKEISEAMAVINAIRGKALSAPMEYDLLDVCSGNALVPIIAAHLLPVKTATAIDTKRRSGRYERVKRFRYLEKAFQAHPVYVDQKLILTAVHPCGELAHDVVQVADGAHVEMVVIMPCCVGSIWRRPLCDFGDLSRYERFALDLALSLDQYGFRTHCYRDKHVSSPANMVIVGER